jgi:hypothetical protein
MRDAETPSVARSPLVDRPPTGQERWLKLYKSAILLD